ncbi:unnamed protein product [Ixodes persulcatus]
MEGRRLRRHWPSSLPPWTRRKAKTPVRWSRITFRPLSCSARAGVSMIFEATQKTPDTPRAPSTEATPTTGPPAGSFGTTSEFPSGGSAAQESYPPLEHVPQFASKRIVTQGASHGRPGPTTAGDFVDTVEVPVVLSLPQPQPSQPHVPVEDIPSNISSRTGPNTTEDVQTPEPDEAIQSPNYASHSEPPASYNNAHNNYTNLSSDSANETFHVAHTDDALIDLKEENANQGTGSAASRSIDSSRQVSNSKILDVNQLNVSTVRYSRPLSDLDVDDYVEASGQANGTSIATEESSELLRLPSNHSGGQTDSSESKSFDLGTQTSNSKIHNVNQSDAPTVTYLPPLHHLDIDDFAEASDDANVTSLDSEEPNKLLKLPFEHSGDADKLGDSDKSNETGEVDVGVAPTEAEANDQSADSILEAKISAPDHADGNETTPSTDPTSWERENGASAKSLESSTKTVPLIIESSTPLNPGKATNSIVNVQSLTEPQSRLTQPYDTNKAARSRSDDSAILNNPPDLKSSLAPRRVPSSPLSQHQIKTPIITDFGLISNTLGSSADTESQVLASLIAQTMSGKKILSRSDFTRLATKPTVIPPETTTVSLNSAVNPSKVLNWISSSANPSELLQRPVQDTDRLTDAVDTVIVSTPTISSYNGLNRGCATSCSWKRRSKSSAIPHDAEISGTATGATDVAETNPTPAIQVPQEHVSEILVTAFRTQISEPIGPTTLSSVEASENGNLTQGNISHTLDPSLTLEGLDLFQSSMPSDHNGTFSSVYQNGHHNGTNWSQTLTPLKPENESAVLLPMSVEDDDTIQPSQKDIVQRMMTVTMLRSSISQMTHTLIGEVLLATPASGSLLTRVATPILETSVKLTKTVSTLTGIILSSSPTEADTLTEVEGEDVTSLLPSRTVDEYLQTSVSDVFKPKTNQSETPALVSTNVINIFTENDVFTNVTEVKNTLPTKSFTFLQTSSELPDVIEGMRSSVHIQPSISPSPGSISDGDNDIFNVTVEGSEEKTKALKDVQVTLMNVTINSTAISDDLNLNTEPSLYTTPAFPSLHTSSHFDTSELHTSSPGNDLQLEASIASSSVQTSTSGSVGTVPELGRDSINNAVIIDGSSATPTLSAKHDGKGNFSQVHSIISSWANQGSGFPYAFNNISVATRVVEYPLVRVRTRMDPPQQPDGSRRRAKWEASKRRQLAGTTAPGSSNRRRKRPFGGNSTSVVVSPSSMPEGAGDQLVSRHQQNSSDSVSHSFETVLSSPNVSLYSDVTDNELSAKTSSFDDPVEESTGPEFSRSMALWPFLAPLLLLMLLPPAVWWLLKPEALPPPPFPPPPFPMPPPSSRRPPSSSHRPPSLQSW